MMSGGKDFLPDAAVTVYPLPGGWSLQGTASVESVVLVEAASCVVEVTKVTNDKLMALEAQEYKRA